ncbi:uncharacterized protein LOC130262661 [Oenanthe melanoleuca]|uniref:uncharacterized protein LOC130262661 n=1 Tax=Oenanthe melanoleuca TaxID=2939378 RepID=UPI0024C118F5|nr:uncharacterized protein LOC130262661 [Oenanthe melanoleuca]
MRGDTVADRVLLNVTILGERDPRVPAPVLGLSPVCVPTVPVANATITPGPPALQVHPGDPVTLRCSVQVGSAPVTFTWLHDGQEVGQGPLLELGAVDVGHSGTYQCVATNQLGQDWHRVFWALSPELALEVTPQGTTGHHWITVAAGLGGSLLFLVLLVGGAVSWHRWNNMAARKQQERAPPRAPGPPRGGGGAVHPRREHQADGGVPTCHHTPGSPDDLRRAASNPWATTDIRGHLWECAVTLRARLGTWSTAGTGGLLAHWGTPPMGSHTCVSLPLLLWVSNIHVEVGTMGGHM